jgi:hypothetical protein
MSFRQKRLGIYDLSGDLWQMVNSGVNMSSVAGGRSYLVLLPTDDDWGLAAELAGKDMRATSKTAETLKWTNQGRFVLGKEPNAGLW